MRLSGFVLKYQIVSRISYLSFFFFNRCLEKKKKKRGVKEEINDLAEKDSPTLLTSDINSVDLQHPPTQTQSSGKIQRKKKAPPNLAFVLIFVLKKEQLFSVSAFIKASYWIHDLNESTQMFGKIFFAAFPTVHYCTYKIQDVWLSSLVRNFVV